MIKVYYDKFENMANIQEVETRPYAKAPKKEKAYRLMLASLYDNNFVYHVSVHESFEQAYDEMMKMSYGTWEEWNA